MAQHEDPRMAQQPVFPPQQFAHQAIPVEPHKAGDTTGWEPQAVAQPSIGAGYNTGQSPAEDTEEVEYGDYFGFDERHRFMMPDGRQWVEFKTLNEGDLMQYQSRLGRDMVVEKATGNARIKINQVEERHALLMVAIVGWHMMRRTPRGWVEEKFNTARHGTLEQWLKSANPALIADLDKAVRAQNPFLLAANDETLEAIDKQIAELQEQRDKILERMQGEDDSATS